MKRTLGDFAQACGGRLIGEDRSYSGVSSDTRSLKAGEIFVALQGPRFNGGDFLAAALAAGAAGALVSAPQELPLPQIVAPETLAALTRAASAWRARFNIPLIGVAGSNGKTTAKEMIASILLQAGPCLATRGNLNNHIGVPLTLLRLEADHRSAVVEMGANRAGEVAQLAAISHPTIGLITNAGAEHLEGFGSLEGAARAEGEMVEALAAGAVAVINADDPFAALWRSLTRARVLTFGITQPADFSAHAVRTAIVAGEFRTSFTLQCPLGRTEVTLGLAGGHNVLNALAAVAAASAAGATLAHAAAGLASMRPVQGRLQLKRAAGGAWVLDDSYNANPSSMRAGIEVLANLPGRKWLVVGDMAELGDYAEESHVELGEIARDRGIERLFATGPLAALTVERFGAGAEWYPDTDALAAAVSTVITPDVHLLVKGSRVNRLERVIAALLAPAATAGRS